MQTNKRTKRYKKWIDYLSLKKLNAKWKKKMKKNNHNHNHNHNNNRLFETTTPTPTTPTTKTTTPTTPTTPTTKTTTPTTPTTKTTKTTTPTTKTTTPTTPTTPTTTTGSSMKVESTEPMPTSEDEEKNSKHQTTMWIKPNTTTTTTNNNNNNNQIIKWKAKNTYIRAIGRVQNNPRTEIHNKSTGVKSRKQRDNNNIAMMKMTTIDDRGRRGGRKAKKKIQNSTKYHHQKISTSIDLPTTDDDDDDDDYRRSIGDLISTLDTYRKRYSALRYAGEFPELARMLQSGLIEFTLSAAQLLESSRLVRVALRTLLVVYFDLDHPGQNYPGQNYSGQNYSGQNYPGQNDRVRETTKTGKRKTKRKKMISNLCQAELMSRAGSVATAMVRIINDESKSTSSSSSSWIIVNALQLLAQLTSTRELYRKTVNQIISTDFSDPSGSSGRSSSSSSDHRRKAPPVSFERKKFLKRLILLIDQRHINVTMSKCARTIVENICAFTDDREVRQFLQKVDEQEKAAKLRARIEEEREMRAERRHLRNLRFQRHRLQRFARRFAPKRRKRKRRNRNRNRNRNHRHSYRSVSAPRESSLADHRANNKNNNNNDNQRTKRMKKRKKKKGKRKYLKRSDEEDQQDDIWNNSLVEPRREKQTEFQCQCVHYAIFCVASCGTCLYCCCFG